MKKEHLGLEWFDLAFKPQRLTFFGFEGVSTMQPPESEGHYSMQTRRAVEGSPSCQERFPRVSYVLFHLIPYLYLGFFLVLFVFATILEVIEDGDSFEEELEFTALLYLAIPAAVILLVFGVFLYLPCVKMSRGCFVGSKSLIC